MNGRTAATLTGALKVALFLDVDTTDSAVAAR